MFVGLNYSGAWAQQVPAGGPQSESSTGRTATAEEEDFSSTPFTEYGEFNEEADEAAETRFFQHGRFFGVSGGVGFEGVSGNRGSLWQGGFPTLDLRVHYWFDFNFALALAVYTARHTYLDPAMATFTANMTRVGLDLKYYFDVQNLSSAITFANPYLVGGLGSFSKVQTDANGEVEADNDSAVGLTIGAGFEFPIKPRKVFFNLEGKLHFVNFKDTDTTLYQAPFGIPNLHGEFYTVTGSFLFTW